MKTKKEEKARKERRQKGATGIRGNVNPVRLRTKKEKVLLRDGCSLSLLWKMIDQVETEGGRVPREKTDLANGDKRVTALGMKGGVYSIWILQYEQVLLRLCSPCVGSMSNKPTQAMSST